MLEGNANVDILKVCAGGFSFPVDMPFMKKI